MPQVEEVKVLNIDEVPHAVDTMSDEVKQLVAVYNEWNQDMADAQKTFAQLQAAVRGLSNQIVATVRAEKEAAAAAETEEVITTTDLGEVPQANTTEVPGE